MALQTSGQIALSDVNTELGNAAGTSISMGSTAVRDLFGIASGEIKMSNGYGASAAPSYATEIPLLKSGVTSAAWNLNNQYDAQVYYMYATDAVNTEEYTIAGGSGFRLDYGSTGVDSRRAVWAENPAPTWKLYGTAHSVTYLRGLLQFWIYCPGTSAMWSLLQGTFQENNSGNTIGYYSLNTTALGFTHMEYKITGQSARTLALPTNYTSVANQQSDPPTPHVRMQLGLSDSNNSSIIWMLDASAHTTYLQDSITLDYVKLITV